MVHSSGSERPARRSRSPVDAGSPAVWDRLAPLYDWQLRLERPALAAAIELAAPRADERLLDLGTGTAALLRLLAERSGRPFKVVGLDTSPEMLMRVPLLPADWELIRADARILPFPDESFEIVTAAYLLHLLARPERQQVLSEGRRVLVPGGRLVTVTPVAPKSILARPYAAVANGLADLLPQLLGGLRLLDPREELERAGFATMRSVYMPRGYPSLCVRADSSGNTAQTEQGDSAAATP